MNLSTFKKACTFILTVFVFFSFISTSCSKKTEPKDAGVVFDTIHVDKTQSIDYKNSKLNCNLHVLFTYPIACKKSSPLEDLQKKFIEKVLAPQYGELHPKEAADSFSAQYIRDFRSVKWDDFFDDDSMLEDENDFIYELNLENEIVYNRNSFISFTVKNTDYEGGSRASNTIFGYVVDLNTGNFLTEEDFAGNNYKSLSSLIAQKIAAQAGLSDVSELENIGYNPIENITPNGNFTIDDDGITYYFNESDNIAASFIGITEVFIPYKELKDYITDDNPISSLAEK